MRISQDGFAVPGLPMPSRPAAPVQPSTSTGEKKPEGEEGESFLYS